MVSINLLNIFSDIAPLTTELHNPPTLIDRSSTVLKNYFIAATRGDEVYDVATPVILTLALAAATTFLPSLVLPFAIPQGILSIANTVLLGAPRLGTTVSILVSYGLKKFYDGFAQYNNVATEGSHQWSEAFIEASKLLVELASGLGMAFLGGQTGRLLGRHLAAYLGPQAGIMLGNGAGFFGLKEIVRSLSDWDNYRFFSAETAKNLLTSSLYMCINPGIDHGISRSLNLPIAGALNNFQRTVIRGITSNTIASSVTYGIDCALLNEQLDFGHYWARDLRASAVYSVFRPFPGADHFHNSQYNPDAKTLPLPDTVSTEAGKQMIAEELAASLTKGLQGSSIAIMSEPLDYQVHLRETGYAPKKTFEVMDGPLGKSGKPEYYYLLEYDENCSTALLRRTADVSSLDRLRGRQQLVLDVQWIVNRDLMKNNDLGPAITEMRVWSPYENNFKTVKRPTPPSEKEVVEFMKGLNPILVKQAGGETTVKAILQGNDVPIAQVSQYQIKLCFDNFRHAAETTDAVLIYGSGLRKPEQDDLKDTNDLKNITGDELTDFIGIASDLPTSMWQMGLRYNQEVVADPSKLIQSGKVLPRSWVQLSALSHTPYLYVNPDPQAAYTFTLKAADRVTRKGRAKIGMADMNDLNGPGGKTIIPLADRISKLDLLARRRPDGSFEHGLSTVWVNPKRSSKVLGRLKQFSDNVYDNYLDEVLRAQPIDRNQTNGQINARSLLEKYACLSYEHEKLRALSELKPEKIAKLVESNQRTFLPNLVAALNRKIENQEIAVSYHNERITCLTEQYFLEHTQDLTIRFTNSWGNSVLTRMKQAEVNGQVFASYVRWWTSNNTVPSEVGSIVRFSRKLSKIKTPSIKWAVDHGLIPIVSNLVSLTDGMQLNRLLPDSRYDTLTEAFPLRHIPGLHNIQPG